MKVILFLACSCLFVGWSSSLTPIPNTIQIIGTERNAFPRRTTVAAASRRRKVANSTPRESVRRGQGEAFGRRQVVVQDERVPAGRRHAAPCVVRGAAAQDDEHSDGGRRVAQDAGTLPAGLRDAVPGPLQLRADGLLARVQLLHEANLHCGVGHHRLLLPVQAAMALHVQEVRDISPNSLLCLRLGHAVAVETDPFPLH